MSNYSSRNNGFISRKCSSCTFLDRKCDGKLPKCRNCLKTGKICIYPIQNDRRRRKYSNEYILYLDERVRKLEAFIGKYAPDTLKDLKNHEAKLNQDVSPTNQSISMLVDKFTNLDLDNHRDNQEKFNVSELGSNLDAVPTMADKLLQPSFRNSLLQLFDYSCPPCLYCLKQILPEVLQWDFDRDTNLSHQLLLRALYGYACMLSADTNIRKLSNKLTHEASDLIIAASKDGLDEYIIQGLLLLSSYELGMGDYSMSYLFISMSCAFTQHLGYHISYDSSDPSAKRFAPQITTHQSAILWSVCIQDRIVTSRLQIPACIHFKRIISPLYKVMLSPNDGSIYLEEKCFSGVSTLWYILDRFVDQICSIRNDLGDTRRKQILLKAARNSLLELKESIDKVFADIPGSRYQNIFFDISYYTCVILLERSSIKHSESYASNTWIKAGESISRLAQELIELNQVTRTPPQFGLSFYLATITNLWGKREKDITICMKALELHGTIWPLSSKLFQLIRRYE